MHLRFWYSEQGCFTKCTIPDYLCGPEGIVHGGILAVLLDEVAEWTNLARLGRLGLTREISVRYLKPVKTNTEIIVESRVISHDDKNAVHRSTIHTTDGTLMAESRSEWILPRLSTIASVANIDEATLQEFMAKYSQKEEPVDQ